MPAASARGRPSFRSCGRTGHRHHPAGCSDHRATAPRVGRRLKRQEPRRRPGPPGRVITSVWFRSPASIAGRSERGQPRWSATRGRHRSGGIDPQPPTQPDVGTPRKARRAPQHLCRSAGRSPRAHRPTPGAVRRSPAPDPPSAETAAHGMRVASRQPTGPCGHVTGNVTAPKSGHVQAAPRGHPGRLPAHPGPAPAAPGQPWPGRPGRVPRPSPPWRATPAPAAGSRARPCPAR